MDLSGISVRKMRIFLTVRATGSFTKSAVQLNMSQPAVTIAMNQIEEAAEVELFVRSGQTRNGTLTEDGERIAHVFSRIVGGYDEELATISSGRKSGGKKLNIFIQDQLATGLNSTWLAELISAVPGNVSEIKCGNLGAVLEAVAHKETFAGLVASSAVCDSFEYRPIQEYGYDLIFPTLSGKSGAITHVGKPDLSVDTKTCLVLGGLLPQCMRQVERYIANHCEDVQHVLNVDSPTILKEMLMRGSRAAVVPSYLTSQIAGNKATQVVSMSPEVHKGTISLVMSPSYARRAKYSRFSHIPAFEPANTLHAAIA